MKLGLDIGGTKIEAAILNDMGEIVYRQRYTTEKRSYDDFFHHVVRIVTNAIEAVNQPLSVGLGIPGAVGSDGLIKNSNILVLNHRPFARQLAHHLGIPVVVANDADCFTLSEAIDGAGKGCRIVFGVILGTGCGGGLCVDNHLISGPNACTGEWGHNSLPRYNPTYDGPEATCYCGQKNCIESFISGSGLERQYFQQFNEHGNVPHIIRQVDDGDIQASALWERYQDQLARALAGIVNMLDPDAIVLGGGVSNIERLYSGLQQRVARYVFGGQCCTPIFRARHGDSSGVRGAAWLGAQKVATAP